MKKLIIAILLLQPLILFAQGNHFSIIATVSNIGKPAKAFLYYSENGKSKIDSVNCGNGTILFNGTVAGVRSASLILDHLGAGLSSLGNARDALPVLIEGGTIKITAKDSIKNGVFTGSLINEQNTLYREALSENDKNFQLLVAKFSAATSAQRNDPEFRHPMDSLFNKSEHEREIVKMKFISQHPDYYVSYLALAEISEPILDVEKVGPLYAGLSPRLRSLPEVIKLGSLINVAKTVAIGAVAPNFTMNDVDSHLVSLFDLRGKYVLLDFWASWCGPCRAENPNIVKAYQQYKNKNFAILGVSLDRPGKRADWLAAIKADGLTWTQVSDLQFWNNSAARLYGIHAIPQNFLIDPQGKIIAKNLEGDELQVKLKSIFN